MAFRWEEYLDLARLLHQQPPPELTLEAVRRCAVSRAYYAAFGYARNYARDWLDFSPRNDQDDHGRLKAHLRSKRRQGTSDSLDRLRAWRNDCDYLDEIAGDLGSCLTSALEEAEYVFRSLPPPATTGSPAQVE